MPRILHTRVGPVPLFHARAIPSDVFAVFRLLVRLYKGAAPAAARQREVGEAAPLETVLFPDILALHGQRDPMYAKTPGGPKEKALQVREGGKKRGGGLCQPGHRGGVSEAHVQKY